MSPHDHLSFAVVFGLVAVVMLMLCVTVAVSSQLAAIIAGGGSFVAFVFAGIAFWRGKGA